MEVALTVFWSLRHREVYCGGWLCNGLFSGLSVTVSLPCLMAVAWTVFWFFCHREVFHVVWQWHGPFSSLSVTVRSAAAYGCGIDNFLGFLSL